MKACSLERLFRLARLASCVAAGGDYAAPGTGGPGVMTSCGRTRKVPTVVAWSAASVRCMLHSYGEKRQSNVFSAFPSAIEASVWKKCTLVHLCTFVHRSGDVVMAGCSKPDMMSALRLDTTVENGDDIPVLLWATA